MDAILRALFVYVVLLLILRVSGKRSIAQLTTFDFVLLLIVGEATQQALLGDDFSVTNAAIVVITLILADVGLARLARRSPRLERLVDGLPVVLMRGGQLRRKEMDAEAVDEAVIREQARVEHGLGTLEQVEHVVLEASGQISIIPRAGVAQAEASTSGSARG